MDAASLLSAEAAPARPWHRRWAWLGAAFIGFTVLQITALVLFQRSADASVQEALGRRLRDIARNAAQAVADAGSMDPRTLAALLRRLRASDRLDAAVLVDGEGRRLADAAGGASGEPLGVLALAPEHLARAWSCEELVVAAPPALEHATHQLYAPVRREGRVQAVLCLEIHDPAPALLADLHPPLWTAVGAGACSALVLVLALHAAAAAVERQHRREQRLEGLARGGKLAAFIAHEVKNPLGLILGAAQVLRRRPGQDAEAQTLLDRIQDEVRRADDELTAFLDLMRELPLKTALLDLRELVTACATLLGPRAAQQGVRLAWTAPAEPLLVLGDARRLRQALINLLLNACEAMPGGGDVQLAASRAGSSVQLDIHDQGPGLDPRSAARFAEPFFTTKAHGTGLGLAMAVRVCARHAGRLERIASQCGLHLRISLPAAAVAESSLTPPQDPGHAHPDRR